MILCFSVLYVLHSEDSSDTKIGRPHLSDPEKAENLRNQKNNLKICQHRKKEFGRISKSKNRTIIPG